MIGACIEAVEQAVPGARCLVMDNSSDDGTKGVVSSTTADAQLVSMGSNEGFGRACNVGARLAATPFVAFVNPDCLVEQLDVREIEHIGRSGSVGLLAPAIHDPGRPPEHLVNRDPRSWLHIWRHVLGPLRPNWLPSPPPSTNCCEHLDWVSGAFFVVSRKEFLDVGGFDPAFFLYYEDTELGQRYREAGLTVKPLKSAIGSHQAGLSSDRSSREAQFMTWSILSWLEYLATHDENLARRHARSIRASYALLASVLLAAARFLPFGKVDRKAAQYAAVSLGLKRAASGSTGVFPLPREPFYGRAMRALGTRGG